MKGEFPCDGKADELSERHFGNVPFAIFDEPEEDFLHRQHETGEHDALGAHHAVREVAHVVVVGGGERQMQPRRAATLDNFRLAVSTRGPHPACFIDRHGAPGLRLFHSGKAYTTAPVLYAELRCR